MSLRLRVGNLLTAFFTINQKGLSVKDLERFIELHEGEYFRLYGAQGGIIDGMAFMKKPILERREVTKYASYNRMKSFWKFEDGRYLLENNFGLDNEGKFLLDKSRDDFEKSIEHNPYFVCEAKVIDILNKNKQGILLDDIISELRDFLPNDIQVGREGIEGLFAGIMLFEHKPPYETVYFDKHAPLGADYDEFSFAEESFVDWDYKHGLYYPNNNFLKNMPQIFKDPIKAKKHFIEKIEELTLIGQLRGYAQLSNLTNTEFLRMYILAKSDLESCRNDIL